MSACARRYAAVLALAVATATPAAAQVFFTDFETDPQASGWFIPSSTPGVTTAQAYSGTHSFYVNPSALLWSPLFTYPQGQFLEVDYKALDPTGTQIGGGPVNGSGLAMNKPGTGWASNVWITRADAGPAVRMQFQGGLAYFDDVTIKPITRAAAAQIQAANFATLMPQPFTYAAPADRQNQIPNTINRLKGGGPLNVAMVGDSIVSDTYSSAFESLVQQRTGGTINVSNNVAGNAGANYWSQSGRIPAIMAGHPDLVLFGGATQSDAASLRTVIQQIRSANPATEIVLMAPMASYNNPFQFTWLAQPADPANAGDYRNTLIAMAAEQGVEYWDLTTPWAQYIVGSGLPYDDFLRDGVHMSARGEMLTADIMQAYFTPVPEPSSLALAGLAGAAAVAWRRRKKSAAH